MHEIEQSDITKEEKEFLDKLLEFIENFSIDGIPFLQAIENFRHECVGALQPVIDAQEAVIQADKGFEVKDANGVEIDVDWHLSTEEINYKNFVARTKRIIGIANGVVGILNIALQINHERENEYSKKLFKLKRDLDKEIKILGELMVKG